MKRHPQRAVACMWSARDFAVMDADCANPDGNDEVFMVQFKTEEIATEFEKLVKSCLDKVATKKPSAGAKKEQQQQEKPKPAPSGGLDRLKPKAGSWKCGTCALNNDPAADKCPACQTPKPGGSSTTAAAPSGFDKLKPKAGSWKCGTCALSVAPDLDKCPACQTLKPGAKPPASTSTPISLFSSSGSGSSGFVFGGAPAPASTSEPPKFQFGGASDTAKPTPAPKFSFGLPGMSTSAAAAEKPSFTFGGATPAKTEDAKSTSGSGAFAALDLTKGLEPPKTTGFTFSLKPTTPSKKEEQKEQVEHEDNEEDDEEVTPADQSQLNFTPIIDYLPEKVEVRTGEEDEEVVFEARAKLFRFDDAAWKERGLGQLKLLRSPDSKKVRVVMRREQVHKVCCNHTISPGMGLKAMEGGKGAVKPWIWWAVDFSDDEVGPEGRKEMFSVRFKTAEESQAFHDAFMAAAGEGGDRPAAASATEQQPVDLDADEDELVIVEDSLVSWHSFVSIAF